MVAIAEGATDLRHDTIGTWWFTLEGQDRALSSGWSHYQNWCPSTAWSQGGPIIERIDGFELKRWVYARDDLKCEAHIHNLDGDWIMFGPTPLIATMRCYVASKLGDEVEVPDELA